MIKCPNCTGELDFKVKDKVIKCQYCGSVFKPEDLHEKVKMSGEVKIKKETKEKKEEVIDENNCIEGKSFTCSQCGAVLMSFDETAITFCSYCGSQAMIESRMKQNKPDFIIPFQKEKEECIKAYKKKVSRALFAPEYMKKQEIVEKFRGIFIPYAIYKLEYHGINKNKGNKYNHRSGDYVYYDVYEIAADVDATYEGISYDLISKFYDQFSHSIPYNFKEKLDFNPNYLIGFYADTKDVSPNVYEPNAKTIASNDGARRLKKHREYLKYGCSFPTINIPVTEEKIGMFPVYFLAIRDEKNKKVSYAVVNGQTGEVAVDIPVAFWKYILYSLILAVLIFVGINQSLVLTPKVVCIASTIFGILSLVLSAIQVDKIKARITHSDDLGVTSVQPIEKKQKEKTINTFRYLYKEILAIIIPILMIFSGTIKDEYYYFASFAALTLVVLSFYDLVKEHNLLVSNKLPQLEKRGGDENA